MAGKQIRFILNLESRSYVKKKKLVGVLLHTVCFVQELLSPIYAYIYMVTPAHLTPRYQTHMQPVDNLGGVP